MQLLADHFLALNSRKVLAQAFIPTRFLLRTRYALLILGSSFSVGAIEPSTTANSQAVFNSQVAFSLQQAQAQALQQQPLQQLWQQRQNIAQSHVLQSGLRTNPELMVGQTGFNKKNEQELSIGISQKLDLFGERKTRQALATIQLNQDSLMRERDEAEIKLMVSVAYWQLAQAEWNIALLNQQQTLSQQALNVAKKRLEAGRIAQVEYQRVQLADQSQQQKSQAVQAQYQIAHLQLAQLLGGESLLPSQLQQPIQFPVLALLNPNHLSEQTLLNQQIQQQQNYAATALQLAKIQAKPQPSLSIAYVQNRDASYANSTNSANNTNNVLGNDRSQRVALGLSVPLALFNKNQGVVQAQYAMQQTGQIQAAWQIKQRQQRAQQQWLNLQAIERQYQQLTTQQLPAAKQIWQKTLIGFEAGKFTVLDVQQASRDYQQIQAEQLDLLQQAWQISHSLQALHLGLNVSDASNTLYELNQRFSMPVVSMGQGE